MCNHHHHHEGEGHHCCGGCGGCCCHHTALTEREEAFIRCLAQIPYLPVTRFLLRSTKSEHLESVALEPVYLLDIGDSMEHVQESGNVLRSLEEKGLITLDYDAPLQGYDYQTFLDSHVYRYFQETVEEAKARQDFLYDIGVMEQGSMALTQRGYAAADLIDASTVSA